jgi:hypothetical protein
MIISPSRQSIRWPVVLGVFLVLLPHQAQAVSLSLSGTQVEEALQYGQEARALPFAFFAREWRAEGMQGPGQRLGGTARLQSPFARVAHTGWTAAHRGLTLNKTDLQRQFKQAGEIIGPTYVERDQDISGDETAWVYLHCLFPAEQLDLQGTVILVVTDEHGDQLPFVFDLSRIR